MNSTEPILCDPRDGESISAPATPWLMRLFLVAVLAVAWQLRTYRSDAASYWFDESSSWKTIQYDWAEMLTPIRRNVHPPLYYFTLKTWGVLFGDGPYSLRAFSALLGVLTSLLAYAVIRETAVQSGRWKLDDRVTACLGAALLAVNGMHLYAGVHARMYTLGTALTLLSVWMAIRILGSGGRVRDWAVLASGLTGLSLTHYYGVFTVAAIGLGMAGQLLWSLCADGWTTRNRRLTIALLISAWCLLNAWLWWLPSFQLQRTQVSGSYHIPEFRWSQLARMALQMVTAPETSGIGDVWPWMAVAWWIAVVLGLMVVGGTTGRVLAFAALFPVLCATAYCIGVRSIFTVRYFLFAQSCLLVGWAVLIRALHWRTGRIVLGLGSLVWLGFWSGSHLGERARTSAEHGMRDAVAQLEAWREPGDVVIVGQGVIHPTIQLYSEDGPDSIYVLDRGQPYVHFQGGPLLRDAEYLSLQQLEAMNVPRVYTVDIYDLWRRGSRFDVPLAPERWRMMQSHWFQEGYIQRSRLFVREYERVRETPLTSQMADSQ